MRIRSLAETGADALRRAYAHAPYLLRLAERTDGAFSAIETNGAAAAFDIALAAMRAGETDDDLRRAKRAAHLAIAAADLSGAWNLGAVTSAVTALADASVESALRIALARRGLAGAGLFAVALGKMGAGELNYSSDIDIAVFYDPDVFDGGDKGDASASKIAQDLVQLLDARTAEGYVFRTDLRLRPDPGSTPLAVSTRMAEGYYESVGQNWERMVWIKARVCAGDRKAGEAFVSLMQPFVWRRHLDFWAIADVHAIKRMINSAKKTGDLERVDPDVKLSPGGIREIEFFAQTQQIILGGRDPSLRAPATLDALAALSAAGIVETAISAELSEAYVALRHIEHRIQMREDQQSHKLPASEEERAHVAALCGEADLAAFDRGLRICRETVHSRYYELFGEEARAAGDDGNLVFTGVDDDPATVETLTRYGFSNPSRVIEQIRRWHRGGAPATRSSRGRELLTLLLPGLLREMSRSGDPDGALHRFAVFFESLRSGVQTLSMLMNAPDLLAELIATFALAPRLAETVGRRPELLEALLDGGDRAVGAWPEDFEDAMDEMRRRHRDQEFLIGHRLLHGRLKASEAARAWSDLADTAIIAMAAAAERETIRRFGDAPGRWCVAAMGRLGGADMTAGSDLDLMVIYDAASAAADDAQRWFTRFTQRLISALSAPTAEGMLYEVDMRLRPSGRSGPVAVRLSAFETYHRESSWTWEHMALTRLRPVAGDAALGEAALGVARAVIEADARRPDIAKDVQDMRARLLRDKPGKGLWDLKMDPGGLLDIEFIAQFLQLTAGDESLVSPNTAEALGRLISAGALEAEAGAALLEALAFQNALLQVLRLAVGSDFQPEAATPALQDRLCRAVDLERFEAVETRLRELKRAVCAVRDVFFSLPATES